MALEAPVWSTKLPTRVFAGMGVGALSGRLKTAILRCRGEGENLRCIGADAITLPPPIRRMPLARSMHDSIVSLARHCEIPLEAIDVLGIDGLPVGCSEEDVAGCLAEETGITVVSGFGVRDRASAGAGRPLSPLPDWFLHRSAKLDRLLIHLGRSLRVTFLAAGKPPERTICLDAGPCCEFLDGFAQELSGGRHPYDPSGHFAVQGRHNEELISKWQSHPFLLRPAPKFLGPEDFDAEFRQASITLAREMGLSARDLLCSANQFIIHSLTDARRRFLDHSRQIQEVWVTGGGCWNGLLWKLLTESLSPIPVQRTDAAGLPGEARRAIHAALLAYCTMENLPANLPSLTGARGSRILGQITPGSSENWDRWILNLADRFELAERKVA